MIWDIVKNMLAGLLLCSAAAIVATGSAFLGLAWISVMEQGHYALGILLALVFLSPVLYAAGRAIND